MRAILAAALSIAAVSCSGNVGVILTPHEPPSPLIGIPLIAELKVTVIDADGRAIEGAEVILQADPSPRRATTLSSGVVRFAGLFIVEPRFFIVCAPGFSCSTWIDRHLAEFTSLQQTVVLRRTADVPRARQDRKRVSLGQL